MSLMGTAGNPPYPEYRSWPLGCATASWECLRCLVCRDADVQAEIAQLRTQLLQADQARELVQEQLAKEKEEREHAQRKVHAPRCCCRLTGVRCTGVPESIHRRCLFQRI